MFEQLHPKFIQFDILENFSSAAVIVPKSRTERELFFLVYFITAVIDVKETSSGQPRDPSYS